MEEAGYSPPTPTPVIPRAKVRHQNRPLMLPLAPLAAVPMVAPMMMRRVVATKADFRPTWSHIRPMMS